MSQSTYQPPQAPVTLTPEQRATLGLAPLEPPKKRSRWISIGIPALTLFVGIGIGGVHGDPATTPTPPAIEASEPAFLDDPTAPAEPEPTEEVGDPGTTGTPAAIEKTDLKMKVKVLDKQCYGSAGCNVEVRPVPYGLDKSAWPSSGTVEWSYKVTGDESGPIIGSFVMNLDDGTYEELDTELMSTRSSGTKIAASITAVEYIE